MKKYIALLSPGRAKVFTPSTSFYFERCALKLKLYFIPCVINQLGQSSEQEFVCCTIWGKMKGERSLEATPQIVSVTLS